MYRDIRLWFPHESLQPKPDTLSPFRAEFPAHCDFLAQCEGTHVALPREVPQAIHAGVDGDPHPLGDLTAVAQKVDAARGN